jgi:hypothetical protein
MPGMMATVQGEFVTGNEVPCIVRGPCTVGNASPAPDVLGRQEFPVPHVAEGPVAEVVAQAWRVGRRK